MTNKPPSTKSSASSIFSSVIKYLESCPGVSDAKVKTRPPISLSDLTAWELVNQVLLPSDLRQFLTVSDGVTFTWCSCLGMPTRGNTGRNGGGAMATAASMDNSNSDKPVLVGSMLINSLEFIHQISLENCQYETKSGSVMKLDAAHHRAYLLHDTKMVGKVVILYTKVPAQHNMASEELNEMGLSMKSQQWNIEICLLDDTTADPIITLYYLSPSFTAYFRLMLAHLGIIGWQSFVTTRGLHSCTYNWLSFYAPDRAKLYTKSRVMKQIAQENNNEADSQQKKKKSLEWVVAKDTSMDEEAFSVNKFQACLKALGESTSSSSSSFASIHQRPMTTGRIRR